MVFEKSVYEKLASDETVKSCFLDFSKSFDCLVHSNLISKLFEFGVRRMLLDRFESLPLQKEAICINEISRFYITFTNSWCTTRVYLGPQLFLICITDLLHSNSLLNFNLFSDDSIITWSFCDFNKYFVKKKKQIKRGVK